MASLEQQFTDALHSLYHSAKDEHGLALPGLLRLIEQHGGVGTARELLARPGVSTAYRKLANRGLLHLAVEAVVLEKRFRPLFTEAELAVAARRVNAVGDEPDGGQRLFDTIVTSAAGNPAVPSRDLAHLRKLIGASGNLALVERFLRGCQASGCRIKVVQKEVTVFQDGFSGFYATGNRRKGTLDLHFHESDLRFARLRAAFPTEELTRGYWGVNLASPSEVEACFGQLVPSRTLSPGGNHHGGGTHADAAAGADELEAVEWGADGAFTEGGRVLWVHLSYERDRELVRQAKAAWTRRPEGLRCDACGMSFAERYGRAGEGYIEAHHRVPLASLAGPTENRVEDLAPVCANCHRMLHREPSVTVEELRARLAIQSGRLSSTSC